MDCSECRRSIRHGVESELAFACDLAIPFALAELSDLLITGISFDMQSHKTEQRLRALGDGDSMID